MPTFKAVIVKNVTGEARTYATEFPDSDSRGAVYMFQDGNYSCDCNRHLFWHRANGDEPDEDVPCGDVLYSVPHIICPDGRELPIASHMPKPKETGGR